MLFFVYDFNCLIKESFNVESSLGRNLKVGKSKLPHFLLSDIAFNAPLSLQLALISQNKYIAISFLVSINFFSPILNVGK
jgi:hypothetical protein